MQKLVNILTMKLSFLHFHFFQVHIFAFTFLCCIYFSDTYCLDLNLSSHYKALHHVSSWDLLQSKSYIHIIKYNHNTPCLRKHHYEQS